MVFVYTLDMQIVTKITQLNFAQVTKAQLSWYRWMDGRTGETKIPHNNYVVVYCNLFTLDLTFNQTQTLNKYTSFNNVSVRRGARKVPLIPSPLTPLFFSITRTNVDLSSSSMYFVTFCDIHLRAISQEVLKIWIHKISLKITLNILILITLH